jgi:hypothetical protein
MTFFVASVAMRTYFSSWHLWAAKHLARLSNEIEDAPDLRLHNRAYATNAVLSSVAFLEAAINEVFDDVAVSHEAYVGPLSAETKNCLMSLWTRDKSIERGSVLKKYREALQCSGGPAFDEDTQLYQDARLLVKLRNALTHARAQTRSSDDKNKLEVALSARFPPNRLMAKMTNPYFPDQCLGAGCANWAASTAERFADEFFERLGIKPNYQRRDDFGSH